MPIKSLKHETCFLPLLFSRICEEFFTCTATEFFRDISVLQLDEFNTCTGITLMLYSGIKFYLLLGYNPLIEYNLQNFIQQYFDLPHKLTIAPIGLEMIYLVQILSDLMGVL